MQSTRSERRRRRRRPHPTIPHTTTPVSTSSLNIITPADIVEITAFAFGERVTPAIPQQQQPKTYEQPASPANESDATEDSLPRLSLLSFTSLASSVLSLPVCASSGDDVHGSNVHDCLESLSEMIPGQAVKSTRCLSFVQNYVIPAAHFADRKFGQDPAILRYVLLHLVALDTIILTCSLGITSAATAGRLVLGAIAATAVGVAYFSFWRVDVVGNRSGYIVTFLKKLFVCSSRSPATSMTGALFCPHWV